MARNIKIDSGILPPQTSSSTTAALEESKPKASHSPGTDQQTIAGGKGPNEKAMDEMMKNGAADLLATMGNKRRRVPLVSSKPMSLKCMKRAAYRKYAIKRRIPGL